MVILWNLVRTLGFCGQSLMSTCNQTLTYTYLLAFIMAVESRPSLEICLSLSCMAEDQGRHQLHVYSYLPDLFCHKRVLSRQDSKLVQQNLILYRLISSPITHPLTEECLLNFYFNKNTTTICLPLLNGNKA